MLIVKTIISRSSGDMLSIRRRISSRSGRAAPEGCSPVLQHRQPAQGTARPRTGISAVFPRAMSFRRRRRRSSRRPTGCRRRREAVTTEEANRSDRRRCVSRPATPRHRSSGAEEAEVQAAEVEVEVVVVEVAGALVAGVARVPRRDQHRWRERRSNRRHYRSRSNPCPGREQCAAQRESVGKAVDASGMAQKNVFYFTHDGQAVAAFANAGFPAKSTGHRPQSLRTSGLSTNSETGPR